MGLAINTGFLADMLQNDAEGAEWAQGWIAATNALLEEEGQPTWDEPTTFDRSAMRPHVGSFPYSFLHYLRRAYTLAVTSDAEIQPTGEQGLTDADDNMIFDETVMMDSHLLCHSDAEGLYVPVDFSEPLFDQQDRDIPGDGMVGSSHGLLRELRLVAPRIGIMLKDGELSDTEANRLCNVEEGHPWEREYIVFQTLWENAKASIGQNTAIVFS